MSRSRLRLDATDLLILDCLQNDGRISNVDLAKRVNLSTMSCLRRVKAHETAGVIKGYYAVLDREQMGYPVLIYVRISLKSQSEAKLRAFEEYVTALPEVRECYMLSGEIDFLLKVVATDTDAYRKFHAKRLKPLRNVAKIKLSLSYVASKTLPGVPLLHYQQP